MRVTFENGPGAFDRPREVVRAERAGEVLPALERMEALRRRGCWLAGHVAYEAGYALTDKLAAWAPATDTPLIEVGAYDAPVPARAEAGPAHLSRPVPAWDAARYEAAFARVRDYIAAGDIYQANLTFPLHAEASGTAASLAAGLAAGQPVGHGALIESAGRAVICRSPELFFEVSGETIRTRPMKGTAPRGTTPEADSAARDGLAASEKDRAENLMIVDLLRNDISRIARIGSVRVPRLFAVESYATLHQMVSEIEGRLRPGTGLPELFAALFPCGSITGAPKIRAMEIISELERAPRGVYCGAIGWVAPSGDQSWAVAIRTLSLRGDPGHWSVTTGVGGGVVHDSTAYGEYQEALWKARYAQISRRT